MLVGRLAVSPFPHMISLNNHFMAVSDVSKSGANLIFFCCISARQLITLRIK